MRALFVRDLLTQRWIVAFAAAYSLFFFALYAGVDAEPGSLVYVVSGIASALMVTLGSFKADRDGTPVLMLSLPATRIDVVNEKYLLLFGSAAFGLACAAVVGFILRAVGLTNVWITSLDIVRVVAGTAILSSVLPFYLRFGHKAVRALVVTALGVGVAAQLGLLLLTAFSAASFTQIVDTVLAWYTRTDVVTRNIIWLLSGLALGSGSYLLSRLVYRRRDIA